jgi:predicted nucleotidyltransferase
MTMTDLTAKKGQILELARRNGATNVRVFGSVARQQANSASDLDVLVAFEAGRSLLDQVALKQDLEELLSCPVDVVVERGMSPYLRDRILAEAVPL